MVRGTTLIWKVQVENKKTISPQGRNGRDTTLFEKFTLSLVQVRDYYIRYPSPITVATGPAYLQMRLVGSSQVHSIGSLGRSSHLRNNPVTDSLN